MDKLQFQNMYKWLLEKYLHQYRKADRVKLLAKYGDVFIDEEDKIISLLKQTEFYHGTGNKHYHYPNGSKYSDGQPQVTSLAQYKYHYIEILGPAGICKIELSFSENI